MKKLVKVHMLPTLGLKIGDLCTSPRYKNKPLIFGSFENSYLNECKGQHLYFTSDEKPKEGDNVFNTDNNVIYVMHKHGLPVNNPANRKIVATTDKSLCNLKQNGHLGQAIIPLPQISQQFIEEYVKAGGIDEVLLEYEEVFKGKKPFESYLGLKVKTDQNNCVITHFVEPKLYTKEELITILEGFIEHPTKPGYKRRDIENWIKENLK